MWDTQDAENVIAFLLSRATPAPSDQAGLVGLLTKAVGDITAALILAGKADKIAKWTAPYVAAINDADAKATAPTLTAGEGGE